MFKVIVNNIELNIVQDTVDVKEENNSFKSTFGIAATTRPLVVLEDEKSKLALGPSNIYTTAPSIFENVVVVEGNNTFNGVLKVVEVVEGGRECDIAYTSAIIPHLTESIHTYFTEITVDGSETTEYESSSETDFDDNAWKGFVEDKISRSFPETDFNFPSIKYSDQFGSDLKEDDDWHNYLGEINQKNIGIVSLNTNYNGLINQNVIVPYFYMLSPLYKIFKETLNYTVSGSFLKNKANYKRLLGSENNQLVSVKINDATVYKQHLTIHPERYLPSWTVSEYLNYLQNSFSIKIEINDVTKSITLDYNEEYYFGKPPLDISNYVITETSKPSYSGVLSYVIKDASGIDFVKITAEEVVNSDIEDAATTVLQTGFKGLPDELTKEWVDLSGVGLLFYDYAINDTYHVQEIDNQTNYISGEKGIATTSCLKWARVIIAAKTLKPKLIVSQKQKNDLQKAAVVYVFKQTFLIKSIEFKVSPNKYIVTLELLTKT